MLKSIKNIFSSNDFIKEEKNKEIDILSGLFIEAANTDGNISAEELEKISHSLIHVFNEDPKIVENSLENALQNKDNSKSLFFYTSKLNKSFSDEKKLTLIEELWEVILADNEIHDFEANLIRRLAGLLYIDNDVMGTIKTKIKKEYSL